MSDIPRTVKELAERIGWVACGPGTEQGSPEQQANVEGAVLSVLRDALVGCQGRVVYTAEDVEAAKSILADAMGCFADDDDKEADEWLNDYLVRILTAAGGVMADEVVEVRGDSSVTVGFDAPERAVMIMVRRGDILHIVRAENTKPAWVEGVQGGGA